MRAKSVSGGTRYPPSGRYLLALPISLPNMLEELPIPACVCLPQSPFSPPQFSCLHWTEGTSPGLQGTPCCSIQCVPSHSYLTWPPATFDNLEPLLAFQTLSSLGSPANTLLVSLPPLCPGLVSSFSSIPALKVNGSPNSTLFSLLLHTLSRWFCLLLKLPFWQPTIHLPPTPQIISRSSFWSKLQICRNSTLSTNALCPYVYN